MYYLYFSIIFLILSNYDLKYIIIGSILIFIFIQLFSNRVNVYSNEILDDIEKYRYLNETEFDIGKKYWLEFIEIINNLYKYDESYYRYRGTYYKNNNPYYNFEKARELFEKSINNFKSMYLMSNNIDMKVLVDALYLHGLTLLKDKSKKLNKMWENNPNVLSNQIILNNPQPHNISSISIK